MGAHQGQEAAAAAERFAAAHRALVADPSIQFTMHHAPGPPRPPQWLVDFFDALGRLLKPLGSLLRPIGRFLAWLTEHMPAAPYALILLWGVIVALLVTVALILYQRLRHGEWRLPRRRMRAGVPGEIDPEGWIPDAAPARAWLEEADALAARGRYAEAAHLLLFRSVEDIARRRPRLVRPALTSRELARADGLPGAARELFAGIARLVERSLFGGRVVDVDDWREARARYADFALPGAWRG